MTWSFPWIDPTFIHWFTKLDFVLMLISHVSKSKFISFTHSYHFIRFPWTFCYCLHTKKFPSFSLFASNNFFSPSSSFCFDLHKCFTFNSGSYVQFVSWMQRCSIFSFPSNSTIETIKIANKRDFSFEMSEKTKMWVHCFEIVSKNNYDCDPLQHLTNYAKD